MRIILNGFGVVGQSLAKLLGSRDDTYTRYGLNTRLVGVADSGGGVADEAGLEPSLLAKAKRETGTVAGSGPPLDGAGLIGGTEADVLIEATPSNYTDGEPGMTNIMTALKRGLHVISVNKGPLALALPSLVEMARYNGVLLRFSGTVGGGTPILNYAKNSLRGERITSFRGILNGTTNYILSSMEAGLTFQDALDDTRSRGYVEADESLDLDGLDAAAKLTILANWVMNMKVTMPQVERTGIRDVTVQDIRRAAENHSAIKLVAASSDNRLEVAPAEIPVDDPMCVNGTLNAISFTAEHSGTQTIIGRGAGGVETASAVLRDLQDIREAVTNQ